MNISTRLIATALASTLTIVTPAFAQHRSSGGRGHASAGGHAARGPVARSGARPVASGGRVFAQSRGGFGVRGGGVAIASRGFRGGFARVAPVRFYRPYYSFRPRFSIGFGLWAGFPIAYSAGFYAPWYYDPYYYGYGYGYPYPYYAPYPYYYPYPYGGPAYGGTPTPYPPNAYPPSTTPYPPGSTTPPGTTTPPGSPTPGSNYPNGPSVNPNRSPSRTISVEARRDLGGFSFEVSPNTAQVFVDGQYRGTVGEFTPQSQPLGVEAGNRRVELRADGYRTVQFDAQVTAGQVLPYQGSMQR